MLAAFVPKTAFMDSALAMRSCSDSKWVEYQLVLFCELSSLLFRDDLLSESAFDDRAARVDSPDRESTDKEQRPESKP